MNEFNGEWPRCMKSVQRSRHFRGPFLSKQWRRLIARFPLPTLEETVETHFPTKEMSLHDNTASICSVRVKKKERERGREKRKFVTTFRQLYIYIFEQEQTSVGRVYPRGKRKCSAFLPALLVDGGNSRRIIIERAFSRKRNGLSRKPRPQSDRHNARATFDT